MRFAPRAIDEPHIYVVAALARKRRARAVKLDCPDAVAPISEAILEVARGGRPTPECIELGKEVLTPDDVTEGVPALPPMPRVEAMFPDGTRLVSCQNPILQGRGRGAARGRLPGPSGE